MPGNTSPRSMDCLFWDLDFNLSLTGSHKYDKAQTFVIIRCLTGEKQAHLAKRKILPSSNTKSWLKFMVSYWKKKLILQVTKCFLPSTSTKRWLFNTLEVVFNLVNQTCKFCFYNFIMLVTIQCLKILSIFKAGPQQRADFHPELFNVLVVGFDLYHCLFWGFQFFFPSLGTTVISKGHFGKPAQTQVFDLGHLIFFVP